LSGRFPAPRSQEIFVTSSSNLAGDVQAKEVVGWAMYDFANSGYTTVVITAIFNAWFVSGIAGKAAWATFAWTAALSVSYAAIMVTAPFVGAWADAHAAKKRVLALTTVGCIVFTAACLSPARATWPWPSCWWPCPTSSSAPARM